MRVFRTKNGRVFQLADKEQMKKWSPEMPLIFIGFIQDKKLGDYPNEIKKDVESYLDEILKDVAIPKLIDSLKSNEQETRKKVAQNLYDISTSNADQLKIAIPHIEDALMSASKEVRDLLKKTLKNYDKVQKRKKTADKRKKLNILRKEMDKIDVEFAEGRINDDEYLKKQKEYLVLKQEINKEEE